MDGSAIMSGLRRHDGHTSPAGRPTDGQAGPGQGGRACRIGSGACEKKTRKLSYKLQLELDNLPARLEQLEMELDALQAEINHPGFFSLPAEQTQPKLDALNAAEAALEHAFSRWEELEALKHQD